MTTTDGLNDDSGGRQKNEPVPSGGYEWTCPYCGTSRLNKSDDEAGLENAIAALRTHVIASDGAEHGHVNEFPSDGVLDLAEHVVKVDRDWGGDRQIDE